MLRNACSCRWVYPRPEQDRACAMSTSLRNSAPREQIVGRGSGTTGRRKTAFQGLRGKGVAG